MKFFSTLQDMAMNKELLERIKEYAAITNAEYMDSEGHKFFEVFMWGKDVACDDILTIIEEYMNGQK